MKSVKILVNNTIEKYKELRKIADTFDKFYQDKIIAQGFLDYYITQIPPGTLAEYQRERQKGKI